jgi:multidrug efflux system membrane fusion protein
MRFRIAPVGRQWVLAGVLLSASGGLMGGAAGCKPGGAADGRAATQPAAAPPAASVTVSPAKAQDVPLYIEEIGTTAAREYVAVQSQVAGQVHEIHFTDGQELKKGDMLFTIDPRPFQAAVAQAEANVGQRRAELELAKQDFARVEDLIKTKAISQQEFDQKQNAVAVSEAQVKAADAAVQTAKLNLDYCYVRSPIDGRAGQRQVDVGNVVKVNDMTLLVIQRLDPIYADFTITERDLPRVREHMRANGAQRLKAQVSVPGTPGEPRTGELTFLDTAVQQGSGRVKLRATLPNEDRHFWAGQFVNVRLVLEVKKGAVLVPSQAIQIGQTGPYVYVVEAGKTAAMRQIKQGQRQDGWVVISDGVKAGENVVTTGQKFLFPGAPVAISPATPAPAAAPAEASAPAGAKPASAPQQRQPQHQRESKSSAKTSSSEGAAKSCV